MELEGYCFIAGMSAILIILPVMGIWSNYYSRGESLENSQQEKLQQQENHNEFNSITRKVKPENQNQEHNVRKEGLQPINQKR